MGLYSFFDTRHHREAADRLGNPALFTGQPHAFFGTRSHSVILGIRVPGRHVYPLPYTGLGKETVHGPVKNGFKGLRFRRRMKQGTSQRAKDRMDGCPSDSGREIGPAIGERIASGPAGSAADLAPPPSRFPFRRTFG
jgi:hypothetical protein